MSFVYVTFPFGVLGKVWYLIVGFPIFVFLCVFLGIISQEGISILISEDFACPVDHFKCPRSFCIESQYLCDGILQCKDGEDEENCGKYLMSFFPRWVFSKLMFTSALFSLFFFKTL